MGWEGRVWLIKGATTNKKQSKFKTTTKQKQNRRSVFCNATRYRVLHGTLFTLTSDRKYLRRTKLVLLSPLSKTKYSGASSLSELSSTDNLNLLSAHRGDFTRHDSQRRFLAQHSVAMLEQCCNHSKQCLNNVATLRCCENRLHESSHAEHHF